MRDPIHEVFYIVRGADLRFYRGTTHGRNVFTDRQSRAKKYRTAFAAACGADRIGGVVYTVVNGDFLKVFQAGEK